MQYPFAMRRATMEDREAVVRLVQAIWPDDWVPYAYEELVADPEPSGLYLAEQEGRLIGCYHLSLTPAGDAYFSAMRIDPSVQGRGFGTLFCRAQVEQARSVGAGHIYLLSAVDNQRAHRTVGKNGFENLGAWLIGHDLKEVRVKGEVRRARPARAADIPAAERLHARMEQGALGEVICSGRSPWEVQTLRPEDWDVDRLVVVDGEDGLEGLMLLVPDSEGGLLIRRLVGTREAAADLLAYAAQELERTGRRELQIGLPVACEPLLAPLDLGQGEVHRMYVFCLPAGKALPEL